jgi:2-methylcitrate dehydratase PrpD
MAALAPSREEMPMLLERIADYALGERASALPQDVIHHAKRAAVDWFAAALPGGLEAPATLLAAMLAEEGGGRALLYPSGARAPLRGAALVNAAAAHTIEFDDIFRDGIFHPGAPTIAAALAAAQCRGADGMRLLRAIVVGYEVSTRIAAALAPAHYRFWHTTGTIGTFGAASAVATILDLPRAPFMHALATAGTLAAGLQQAFRSDSMSKPLHAGHAAEAGALAALAASRGLTGALDILEGEAGMGVAMGDAPDWDAAFDDLGRRYNIARITVKNHGCCGHTFAAIDGALALREAHALTADRVARLRIGTYRTAIEVAGNTRVATAFEVKFSLPYTVATALVHGSVRRDAFVPARLADPVVQDLMQRIELVVDPECDAAFPHRRAAVVEIETTDGRRLEHRQPTRKGDPEAPLSDAELEDKFRELAAPAIGTAAAGKLMAALWSLERQPAAALLTLGAP